MQALIFLFFAYFLSLHTSVAAMETLCPLVYVSSLGVALYTKNWILPSKIFLIALAGLFTVAITSFFANSLPLGGFLDYVGEFRWMLIYLGLLQFYNLCFKRIDFGKLVFYTQCLLILAGFYSCYQFFAGHDFFRSHPVFHKIYEGSPYYRPNSFFSLPTTYAYASSMFFAFSLAFWLREKPRAKWQDRVTRFYFFISSANIFLTFTRAAWISFVASVASLLYLINKKIFLRIFLVFIILLPLFYTSMPSLQQRIDSIFDLNYVANHTRIYLWKANWNIFKENPWVGIGFNQNEIQIDSYLDVLDRPEVMRGHPHNTYLNFLSGLGSLGLLFFMLFVVLNLKSTIQGIRYSPHRLHKTLYIGALGAQMVLLIGGLTECNFEDIELTHQYILYTALVEYLRQQDFPS